MALPGVVAELMSKDNNMHELGNNTNLCGQACADVFQKLLNATWLSPMELPKHPQR